MRSTELVTNPRLGDQPSARLIGSTLRLERGMIIEDVTGFCGGRRLESKRRRELSSPMTRADQDLLKQLVLPLPIKSGGLLRTARAYVLALPQQSRQNGNWHGR